MQSSKNPAFCDDTGNGLSFDLRCHDRGITQEGVDRMATCKGIDYGQDLIIIGSADTGKS